MRYVSTSATDLVLQIDKRVFHLQLQGFKLADKGIILVGRAGLHHHHNSCQTNTVTSTTVWLQE